MCLSWHWLWLHTDHRCSGFLSAFGCARERGALFFCFSACVAHRVEPTIIFHAIAKHQGGEGKKGGVVCECQDKWSEVRLCVCVCVSERVLNSNGKGQLVLVLPSTCGVMACACVVCCVCVVCLNVWLCVCVSKQKWGKEEDDKPLESGAQAM